jgi:hypothetical protein
VGEGHIDGHASFSSFSFDTTQRDDFVARGNELVGNEVNVEGFIEAGEKALEHVLEALEMAAADGHPLWYIVYDVGRLETAQRFAMAWNGSFEKRAHTLFVIFGHTFLLHLAYHRFQTFLDSIFNECFVRIAVQPTFSSLRRCDHGMLAQPRVLGCMAVRRVIATARRAAFLAYAQMDPTGA